MDSSTERNTISSFFGDGQLPQGSFSVISTPMSSDFPTRTSSFRRISPGYGHRLHHKKKKAPPPPNLSRYSSLPSSSSSGEGDILQQRNQKKRRAPPPPDHIRSQDHLRSWSTEAQYSRPPLEPPCDYDLDDDDDDVNDVSVTLQESQNKDSGLVLKDRIDSPPSAVSSAPEDFSKVATGIVQPPTPPPLPLLICEVSPPHRPPTPPPPPPVTGPPPPLPHVLPSNDIDRDGLDPTLKAQIIQAAKKRITNGPIVVEKQDPFLERFARELKKAYAARQQRMMKGTIKMKFQQKNTIIYKASESSEGSRSTPPTPKTPTKKIHLSSSEVLLNSLHEAEEEVLADGPKRQISQNIASLGDDHESEDKSWTPEQDLPGDVFDEDVTEDERKEISANKADFYEMLYGKPALTGKQYKQRISTSSDSSNGSRHQGLTKLKKSMKNALGSIGKRGPKSRKSIDAILQKDSSWQIYPACLYDEPPEGPITIARIEKGPAYAYHPGRGQLVLLPDYDRIIITDDGRKFREESITKGERPKNVEELVERKLSSVGEGALILPTPLRDNDPRLIQERHKQDVVEIQFQQVQEMNKQFQNEALAASGLNSPAWDLVKNPRVRRRSDRFSWETTHGTVKMTKDGTLMYCDPKNDFKEESERIILLNGTDRMKKHYSSNKKSKNANNIVPVSKPMLRVLRKGWKAYKDSHDNWDISNGNPVYSSDEEEGTDTLTKSRSEPMFQAAYDSGYEGGYSAVTSPDEPPSPFPTSTRTPVSSSCPSTPERKKHRNGTVLSPLACGYVVGSDGSLTSSQPSLDDACEALKGSPAPSLTTSMDNGLNSSGIRQNTVIHAVLNTSAA